MLKKLFKKGLIYISCIFICFVFSTKAFAADEVVNFEDIALKNYILRILGKSATEDVMSSEMETIESLGENGDIFGVTNISGLQYAKNLKYLNLDGNAIEDISALKNLDKLETLYLGGSHIRNITALENLDKLVDLNIAGDFEELFALDNIDVLSNLRNLEILSISNRGIKDISALKELSNLKSLYLSENPINDISPLENLVNLTNLDLVSTKEISNIEPLKNLTQLKDLKLTENQIVDISALSNLTNLNKLYLNANKIEDVSALSELINLKSLRLNGNKIKDINSLNKLVNLTEFMIPDNKIQDISVISNFTNLRQINLSNNRIYDLSPLNDINGINKRRGYAKQLNELKVDSKEFTLPSIINFDGSKIDFDRNDDNSIKLYKAEICCGGNYAPVVEDGELVPIEKQFIIKEQDGKYILPDDIKSGAYSIQWFVNSQQWGAITLNISILNSGGGRGNIVKDDFSIAKKQNKNIDEATSSLLQGKEINSYAFGNDIYYKLRDLAILLKDSDKKFNIIYDANKTVKIEIKPNAEYKAEKAIQKLKKFTSIGNPKEIEIMVKEEMKKVKAVLIDGSNYVSIQSILEILK